jgi:hypothetical protein
VNGISRSIAGPAYMKNATIILFCFIFLVESMFPRVELSDFSQLPELFRHFEKHQKESPGISFLEFIYLHYGASQHLSQDANDHERLPFSKTHHVFSFQLIHDVFVLRASTDFIVLMKIGEVAYREGVARTIPTPIWQPPKI